MKRVRATFLVAAPVVALALSMTAPARAATPEPDPLVRVHTVSGGITRDTDVPIGGAPVPIDVNDPLAITPDITVAAGFTRLEDLPSHPLVPYLEVRRAPGIAGIREASPPLTLDATVTIRDAGTQDTMIALHLGYTTPPGGQIPTLWTAKAILDPQTGFIHPLVASIDAPGYNGPLTVEAGASTNAFDGKFSFAFDPIPQSTEVTIDPGDDGIVLHNELKGPEPDVKLAVSALLNDLATGHQTTITSTIERLPRVIDFTQKRAGTTTTFDYAAQSSLPKPDVSASLQSLERNGTPIVDASLKLNGFPNKIHAAITNTNETSSATVKQAVVQVLDGGQIDAVDFEARNWVGANSPVPVPALGPDQFLAVSSRRVSGEQRFRLAGRFLGVRSLAVQRLGANLDGLDIQTDMGDGVTPLRAIFDLDDRGVGASNDARHLLVDSTVRPLPTTIHTRYEPGVGADPTHLVYDSSQVIDVAANLRIATLSQDGCGQSGVTCATATIDKLPTHLELFLPNEGGTDFSIHHTGGAGSRPDVRATVDHTPADAAGRSWANVELLRVPNHVTGRLKNANGTLAVAEFHACTYDFGVAACRDAQGALGRVRFTARATPERTGLPARPDTAPQFVTLLKRGAQFEVAGQVDEVRNVVFHQRVLADGTPSGTLGALVDVGSGNQFDVVVDQIDGPKTTNVRVNVDPLPSLFSACIRKTADVTPPDPATLPADTLLKECDRTDIVKADAGEAPVTPLTAYYTASTQTKVTADVLSIAPNESDSNRSHTNTIHVVVDKLPATLRTDLIPSLAPPASPGRKMKVRYDASDSIKLIDIAVQSRRTDSVCEDPRTKREAMCLSATLHDLPKTISATIDPDDSRGDIDLKTSAPPAGEPRLSIDPIKLSTVTSTAGAKPLIVEGRIIHITDHVTGKLQSGFLNDPPEPKEQKKLTNININACPPEAVAVACDGIETIEFTATNSLADDLLPTPPPPAADITQDFTFMQRAELFRAHALINAFREVGMSKLDSKGKPFRELSSLRASFGTGAPTEKMRGYVDSDDGVDAQLVDATISKVPRAITVCWRDAEPVHPRSTGGFCEVAPNDAFALQTRLDVPATGLKPDIDIRNLVLTKGGRTSVLTGNVFVQDLGERIDVTAGKIDKSGIKVEGHRLSDGAIDNVVGRVTFDLRNFFGLPSGDFPWSALTSGAGADADVQPDVDPRNVDGASPAGRNFMIVTGKPGKIRLRGSIPTIKRIEVGPGPCDPSDQRFPPLDQFADQARPQYTCARALLAQGRPLGIAVRMQSKPETATEVPKLLDIEDGHIDSVPAGADGLAVTIASAPTTVKDSIICRQASDAATPLSCRPPMLSLQAPKSPGQVSHLEARVALGTAADLENLRKKDPLDPTSQRLQYERNPSNYPGEGAYGARIKIGSWLKDESNPGGDSRTALRIGLNVELPNFLDIDPPTSYSCLRLDEPSKAECGADPSKVKAELNQGFGAKDIFIKLVAANASRLGTDVAYLGRVAVLVHDFHDDSQTIVTGVPDANQPNGATNYDPENIPPPGPYDLGALVPGYLDAKVYLRDKFRSKKDGERQQKFVQVDGRINSPLNLGLRVERGGKSNELGGNRAGQVVPFTQFSVRNAPGLGNGVTNFNKPTFRIRAELRKDWTDDSKAFYECDSPNTETYKYGFGANFCIILPTNVIQKWTDVNLNMNPNGGSPGRTVDAIVDSSGAVNQVDMRAFDSVNGTGGPAGKGSASNFTPQAGLRMTNFQIGLKVGAGIGIVGAQASYRMEGDLILHAHGDGNTRMRLSQDIGGLRMKTEGGTSGLNTDMQAVIIVQLHGEALFGLVSHTETITSDSYHQPIGFYTLPPCSFFGAIFPDAFTTSDNDKTSMILLPTLSGLAGAGIQAISAVLTPWWCLVSTPDDQLINSEHPAPAFAEPDRPIENMTAPAPVANANPGPGPLEPSRSDITVTGTQTFCGTLVAKTLHVTPTGRLLVGQEGTSINTPVTTPSGAIVNIPTPCDGGLTIDANDVQVDAGGVISGSATRVTNGAGHPGAIGAGAGHIGSGGASGGGGGGGPVNSLTPPDKDFGSTGGVGTGTAAGGLGGGTLRIVATNSITVAGAVAARGGDGGVTDAACTSIGGGGGSGGAVWLQANRVNVGGGISVDGGHGGFGGKGGGGGGAGRITIDTIVRNTTGSLTAAGIDGATAPCANGGKGNNGDTAAGLHIDRAASVALNDPATPDYVNAAPTLKVSAIQVGGGPLDIIVCRKFVASGTPNAFSAPGLNPPAGDAAAEIAGSTCQSQNFAGPTAPSTDAYDATMPAFVDAADGYYSYFAIAAKPFVAGDDCLTGFFAAFCTLQDPAPSASTVKFGLDRIAPDAATITAKNGVPGCGDGLCVRDAIGRAALTVTDAMSGVSNVQCKVNANAYQLCDPSSGSVTLTLAAGRNASMFRFEDVAGNVREKAGPIWFFDRTPPNKPVIAISSPPAVNGWTQVKPTLAVSATDPDPASGFADDGITLTTDDADHNCGLAGSPSTSCAPAVTDPWVPDEGKHTFIATATDRLNNKSVESDPALMQVDHTPPKSRQFLAPRAADGKNNWYRTSPALAFGAFDPPGGSGVDPALPPSGVFYAVDGGPELLYHPDDDIRLPDGIHSVCFHAVDVAGNAEASNCNSGIKVDTTLPVVVDTITPANPDGRNSWYLTHPTVAPSGNDSAPATAPSATVSGLDKVQYQLDDDGWTAAAPFQVPAGIHTVRVRGFDNAGNQSLLTQREVRVDVSTPTSRVGTFPSTGNAFGWFRQVVTDSVASSAGRDAPAVDGASYVIDSGPSVSYFGPFAVTEGNHDIHVTVNDLGGASSILPVQHLQVDLTPPSVRPTGLPGVIIAGLPAALSYLVADTMSPDTRVHLAIYDETDTLVRRLAVPGDANGFSPVGPGAVSWDGTDDTGRAVLPGVYSYRVEAVDRAGHSAVSSESGPIIVVQVPAL